MNERLLLRLEIDEFNAAYAAALDAIIRIDLKGDGGNDGQELLSVLRITPQAA